MKRLLYVCLCLILSMSLFACGGGGGGSDSSPTSSDANPLGSDANPLEGIWTLNINESDWQEWNYEMFAYSGSYGKVSDNTFSTYYYMAGEIDPDEFINTAAIDTDNKTITATIDGETFTAPYTISSDGQQFTIFVEGDVEVYDKASSETVAEGFTFSEVAGKTLNIAAIYNDNSGPLELNSDGTINNPDCETNWAIQNGELVTTGCDTAESVNYEVIARDGNVITTVRKVKGIFSQATSFWGVDFTFLNNDVYALANWFTTNGFWPGYTLTTDGPNGYSGFVINNGVVVGTWFAAEDNVLYFTDEDDYKAYKLENNVLLYATDADANQAATVIVVN